jgi:hypothetical protein
MPLWRYLQHWLTGRGPRLQVADFVPDTHPIRQWADTFPWTVLMAERLAIQAATAMEDGLVSPAHLVVDPFPREQGSPRVNDAATLDKAPKKSSTSSTASWLSAPPRAPSWRRTRSTSRVTSRT